MRVRCVPRWRRAQARARRRHDGRQRSGQHQTAHARRQHGIDDGRERQVRLCRRREKGVSRGPDRRTGNGVDKTIKSHIDAAVARHPQAARREYALPAVLTDEYPEEIKREERQYLRSADIGQRKELRRQPHTPGRPCCLWPTLAPSMRTNQTLCLYKRDLLKGTEPP